MRSSRVLAGVCVNVTSSTVGLLRPEFKRTSIDGRRISTVARARQPGGVEKIARFKTGFGRLVRIAQHILEFVGAAPAIVPGAARDRLYDAKEFVCDLRYRL